MAATAALRHEPLFDLVGADRYYGFTEAGWTQHSATVTFTLPDECDGVYDLYGEQYVYGGATPYSDTLPGAFTVVPDLAVTGLDPETCASDHGDLTLTVYGEGFIGYGPIPALHPSVVRWNGTAVPTPDVRSGRRCRVRPHRHGHEVHRRLGRALEHDGAADDGALGHPGAGHGAGVVHRRDRHRADHRAQRRRGLSRVERRRVPGRPVTARSDRDHADPGLGGLREERRSGSPTHP